MKCKLVRGAYRALPLAPWRALLLDRHIDRCPRCQARALDLDAVRRLAVAPESLAGEPPLRPFAPARPARRAAFLPRFAYALLLAAAILGLTTWLSRLVPLQRLPEGTVTVLEEAADTGAFAVLEARINNAPARPIVFKPGQGGMTIVWFERSAH